MTNHRRQYRTFRGLFPGGSTIARSRVFSFSLVQVPGIVLPWPRANITLRPITQGCSKFHICHRKTDLAAKKLSPSFES